jgi:hypothetical protein
MQHILEFDDISSLLRQRTTKSIHPSLLKRADGFKEVSCVGLARAVDRAAGWLEWQFRRSRSFDVLASIGPTDL